MYVITSTQYLLPDYESFNCIVGVSEVTTANDWVVLGATFLRNYYVTLNFGAKTVMLSKSAHPDAQSPKLNGWSKGLIVLSCV